MRLPSGEKATPKTVPECRSFHQRNLYAVQRALAQRQSAIMTPAMQSLPTSAVQLQNQDPSGTRGLSDADYEMPPLAEVEDEDDDTESDENHSPTRKPPSGQMQSIGRQHVRKSSHRLSNSTSMVSSNARTTARSSSRSGFSPTSVDLMGKLFDTRPGSLAKGFSQIEGVDYDETFAPVVKFSTLRALLALATELNLEIHRIDVKTAFLHGHLTKEISIEAPAGFSDKHGKVWLLKKSLYGLKQASREWYNHLRSEFEAEGFTCSEANHSVFWKRDGDILLIVAVYIDDMLIFGNNIAAILEFKSSVKWEITDAGSGDGYWVLNMEVKRDPARRMITLSQHRYIEDLLARHELAECHPVGTPMAVNIKLSHLLEAEVNAHEY